MIDVAGDLTGIELVESTASATKPDSTDLPKSGRTVPFAYPLKFSFATEITWVRVRDGAGNWSAWAAVASS